MALTEEQIGHVAMLARLGLSADEREKYRLQLDAILEHIDRLQKIDTSHLPETAQVGELFNVWREDVVVDSLPVAKAMQNAPRRSGDQFQVGAIQE